MRFKSSKNSCAPESFERAEVITHTVSAQTRKACPAKTGYTSLTYTNGYLILSNSGTQTYARIPIIDNGTLGAIEPLAFYPAPIQAISSINGQVYLAGNGGEVAMVNGGSEQRMISRSTENWLTLAAYDGPETHNLLVAGANGAFARLKGNNVEEITRIPINSNTEEDILKIVYDTGANAEVLSDDHYTLLGRNGMGKYQHYAYTNGTPLSIAGATTSANIYCGLVDQYSGNTNVIAAGERGVHQRAAATNRSNNFEVYPLPLHKVAFSATNHGIVVGDWGTVRTTTNGGEMWQTISPTFASINAVDHVYAAAVSPEGQFKVAGDNGFVGSVVNNAVVADAEALPNSAIFKDMAYHDAVAETWVAVGADGAAGYVASLHDSETGWIGQAAAGAGFNALTTLPLNDHFIAVGNNAQAKLFKDWSNNEYIASNLTTAPVPVSTHFYDVAMIDAIKGYIVGSGGVVLKCAEGSYPDVDEFGVFHYSDIPFTTPLTTDDGLLGQVSAQMDIHAIGITGPYTGILAGQHITNDGTPNNDDTYARLFDNQNGVYSTLFWYDMLGRIVASQNTKQHQAENRGWSYSLYDELGRVYQAGLKHENPSGEDVFADIFGMDINGAYNPNTIDYAQFEAWIGGQGGREQVTTTTYDVPSEAILPMTYAQTHLRKRVSSVCYEALYDADAATYDHATHYSYDIHGNVYSLLQDNKKLGDYLQPLLDVTPPLMGDNQRFKRVDYTYDLISGNVHQVSYQQGEPDQFIHRYKYDGDNRITEVRTSKDGLLWDLDAKYLYYAHGPLARTELGDNQVQGVDYAYTLQGWLKGTNSSSLTTDRDMGGDSQPSGVNQYFAKDAVSFSLHYFNGDYQRIGATPTNGFLAQTTGTTLEQNRNDLWNGNIGMMLTHIADPDPNNNSETDRWGMLGMAYRYDQLNRLVRAVGYNDYAYDPMLEGHAGQFGVPGVGNGGGMYKNTFSYDANGNILNQYRYSQTEPIDDLVYGYELDANNDPISNRLYHVQDWINYGVNTDGIDEKPGDIYNETECNQADIRINNNYGYTAIGELERDNAEDIERIEWRVDSKISRIIRTDNSEKKSLEFEYDAMGNRIAKHVYGDNSFTFESLVKSTYYVRDASGNVMGTYEHTPDHSLNPPTVEFTCTERPIYGSSRLGMDVTQVVYTTATEALPEGQAVRLLGNKQYEIANHLGNVLVVVSDVKVIVHDGGVITGYAAQVISATDYSPFGVALEGRTFSSETYRYGLNGKEKDDEGMGGGGQTYDYGFRIYNPGLGKFLSVDPLSGSYPWYTPYQFAGNAPILFIDIDGLEPLMPPIFGLDPILMGSQEMIIMEGASRAIIRSPEVKNIGRYTAENTSKYEEVLSRTVEQTKEALKNGEKSTRSSREEGLTQHRYHKADKHGQGEVADKQLLNRLRPDSWTEWMNSDGKWIGRLTEFKPHNIESINRAVNQMSRYLEQLIKENPHIEEWIQIIETYTVTPLTYVNPTVTLTIDVKYTVRSGDTLTSIAANFNTTVSELVQLNGITDPNKIYVNQTVVVKKEQVTEPL